MLLYRDIACCSITSVVHLTLPGRPAGPDWTAWARLDRLGPPGPPGPACMVWAGLHGLQAAPGHPILRRGRTRLFQASTDSGPQARPRAAWFVAWPVENTA